MIEMTVRGLVRGGIAAWRSLSPTAILAVLLYAVVPGGIAFPDDRHALSWAPYARHIEEASRRFGIPKRWIEEVLHAESHGDRRAVSPAGAIGLMQQMPPTWEELRERHRLGKNAYDARDNILTGAAYIAELHVRYGSPGFLAAYNAGPRRYADYIANRRPLPAETRAYVAKIAPRISAGSLRAMRPAERTSSGA